MACNSSYNGNKNYNRIDFEDLFLEKSKNKNEIRKNIPIFKTIIKELLEFVKSHNNIDRKKAWKFLLKKMNRKKVNCKKNVLFHLYRLMKDNKEIPYSPNLSPYFSKKPTRNLSGVTVITILTSPYPDGQKFSCKHNCYYCPAEPDQPRSYLKKEPAVARANANSFDPIL